MGPERLGRTSLAYNGIYCAVVGAIAAIAARPLARLFGVRTRTMRGTGIAAIGMASQIGALRRRANWRPGVIIIGSLNIATMLLLLSTGVRRRSGRFLTILTAAELGAFGAVQLVAALGDGDREADDSAE